MQLFIFQGKNFTKSKPLNNPVTRCLLFATLVLICSIASVDSVIAQCDTSRWKASIDPGAGGPITEVLPASTVFQGGILTATPSASFPNPYYVSFSLKDTFCITNNFSVEVRLKNDPAEGGAVAGDTWLSLTGSGITAGCLLEGLPSSQIYTGIYVGSSWMGNIPQLVMDLTSWRTIRLDFVNNVVKWSYDGSNFFAMNYSGSICNINNLVIGFREAGKVDYVKIFDAVNTVVYYEEFNDCNNLALAPDCVAPDVTATSSSAVYCEHDSIKLTGASNVSVQYTWSGPNSFTSALQNPVIPNAVPGASGWYKLTGYVNPCTPVHKDSVFITVYPEKFTNVYAYICNGDAYFAAGQNQTTAGLYYDTLNTSAGCDSIILTYLSLLSTSASSGSISICSNDSFFVGGSYQHVAGIYHDTLINHLGCDSVITTTLSLIAPVYHNVSMNICQGDSVFLAGNFQHLPGIYNDTAVAITGCDSVIVTTLSVIAPISTSLNISICQGDSYLAGGGLQTQTGIYYDTLTAFSGCDSVIITHLNIILAVSGFRTVFICENDSFLTGGAYQYTAGLYMDTLVSAAGCDSMLTTDLHLILPLYANLNSFICQGDSMFVGGNFQKSAGFYNDTLTAISTGCDSIIITHLQLILPLYTTVTQKICFGDSVFAGGNFQNSAGTYIDTLQSATGCDSIVTTILEIISPVNNAIAVSICNGSSYFTGGNFQTATGTYIDTLQSAAGCDSILTTHLQVLFPVYENRSVSICDGQSYFAGGDSQTLSGNYPDTLIASNGCDSILITQLTVLANPFVYLGQDTTICEGTSAVFDAGNGFASYYWNDGSDDKSIQASAEGMYWVKVSDLSGCSASDTIVISGVYQNPENFLPADSAVCGKFVRTISVPGYTSYQWSNHLTGDTATFTAPGQYSLQVTDSNGCKGTDEIVFESVCEKALIMPNAFTPNGDGLNDVLKPVLLDEIVDYELKIFNRWGRLIFSSDNPDNGWTGRENGLLLPIEEYVWTARYKNGNGEEQFEKGSVALLK
ncbi:MAG: gliding motility-associated C-terminal domain-containing protein [Chitinophagales bacterium]